MVKNNLIVDAPLSPKQSISMAKKMLNHNKHEQFIQAELNRLRKQSKIDYVNNGLSLGTVANYSANQVPEAAGQ